MIVSLDVEQSFQACQVGVSRRLAAVEKGRRDAKGYRSAAPAAAPFEVDILGAAGELAASIALGAQWDRSLVPDKESGDLQLPDGPLDVRATKYDRGSLLVHPNDLDDRRFLLVTGQIPEFTIRGWAWGGESKRRDLWRVYKGRGSFWVPQSDLRPVEELQPKEGR